jgi:hypothetical protein
MEPGEPEPETGHSVKPGGFITYRNTNQVLCPFCGQAYTWTDDIEMYREAQEADVDLKPAYHTGIVVAGREPAFLLRCKNEACGKPFAAEWKDYLAENATREKEWWRNRGRFQARVKGDLPPPTPKSVFRKPEYVAVPIGTWAESIRNERNPFIRAAIMRRVEAAGWHIFPPMRTTPAGTVVVDTNR